MYLRIEEKKLKHCSVLKYKFAFNAYTTTNQPKVLMLKSVSSCTNIQASEETYTNRRIHAQKGARIMYVSTSRKRSVVHSKSLTTAEKYR